MQVNWKPTIVAFCCNWCSYAGADLSGTNRLQYPANVKIIRIPCSCRLNPMFILRAFQRGADGVILCGCHPGDCHYTTGNYYARRRMTLLFSMLDFLGVEQERTRVEFEREFEYGVFAGANLSKYCIAESKKDGVTAVFLKPCDTYSFVQLLKEYKIRR